MPTEKTANILMEESMERTEGVPAGTTKMDQEGNGTANIGV